MSWPDVVAHRGASAVAPENTLEAFERAIELGADMVEFDVRSAPDGTLVVSHDPLPPVLDPAPPTLEQVVDLCAGRIALDVELKEAGTEAEALRIVSARVAADAFVVTSFLERVVVETKRLRPDVRVGRLLRALDDIPTAADFLAPHVSLLDGHLPGEGLAVWTVNDGALLERCLRDPRVAAVITDDPRLALTVRASLSRSRRAGTA
jgi:glycerophosphoryl diester phosphodiesterase